MPLNKEKNVLYLRILSNELEVSLGCTEPIAIAYAAAQARKTLGERPTRYIVSCSGNVIKNAKSVIVPNTNGLKGIESAVLAGAIDGDPDRKLEVLSSVRPDQIPEIQKDKEAGIVTVRHLNSTHALHIQVECFAGDQSAMVEIIDYHTNISKIMKNGNYIKNNSESGTDTYCISGHNLLNVKDILEYADTTDIEKIRPVIERQIRYNTEISNIGLAGEWGVQVGRTLMMNAPEDDIKTWAMARTAAGSDARMDGCPLPVVTNSGSGNQGICASMPVIEYARYLNVNKEKLLRALVVSNLIAIHQKKSIGRLSAYCGAVCASCGSGAAIAYLNGADYDCICNTIINTIANIGGMVCDGAKPSCAAKVASSVSAALLGYALAARGYSFKSGEGIVKEDVETTVECVGRMVNCGMIETDKEILKIMTS